MTMTEPSLRETKQNGANRLGPRSCYSGTELTDSKCSFRFVKLSFFK